MGLTFKIIQTERYRNCIKGHSHLINVLTFKMHLNPKIKGFILQVNSSWMKFFCWFSFQAAFDFQGPEYRRLAVVVLATAVILLKHSDWPDIKYASKLDQCDYAEEYKSGI